MIDDDLAKEIRRELERLDDQVLLMQRDATETAFSLTRLSRLLEDALGPNGWERASQPLDELPF